MRTGEIALERIDAGLLAAFDDLDPGVLAIFLHDRRDQDARGVLVLDLLEFLDPGGEGPIADQLDVFPADDFLGPGRPQPPIARLDVDDLGRVETDRLADHRPPALVERLAD